MTLGSVDNNPHLLIWSLVLHQRKHICVVVRGACGGCLQESKYCSLCLSLIHGAGKQPFKHMAVGKGKLECRKDINHTLHKSFAWMSSSFITNTFACHVHYKNKTIYGLFKVPFINLSF